MRAFQVIIGLLIVGAILTIALGYTGRLHPAGDFLAVGRGFAAAALVGLAVVAVILGMRYQALMALAIAGLTGLPVVLAHLWPGLPGTFTLYQKNLKYSNSDLAGLEADIRATEAMAVTLQEVSEPNLALLAALADVYPSQHVCPAGVGGPAVISRLPAVPGATVCAPGLAAMQVTRDDGKPPVWIVSIHLHWPWPHPQGEQVAGLLPVLAGLEGPVAMAGDFNMVRWGHSVQSLAAVARVKSAGPNPGTYLGFGPFLHLPIDHSFAPGGGRNRLRGALGSDHLGLFSQLDV